MNGIAEVAIKDVVDEFSAEITKEDESEYIGSYDLEMKSPDTGCGTSFHATGTLS